MTLMASLLFCMTIIFNRQMAAFQEAEMAKWTIEEVCAKIEKEFGGEVAEKFAGKPDG